FNAGPEDRFVVQKITSHSPPLWSHPRTDKGQFGSFVQRDAPGSDASTWLLREKRIQVCNSFGVRVGHQGQPMVMMTAPQGGRIGDIMQVGGLTDQEIAIGLGRGVERFRATS